MFDVDPREDQKTDIVGDEAEMVVSGRDIPTDELVPAFNLKSRTERRRAP